jgi:addiction module HigA family antidote
MNRQISDGLGKYLIFLCDHAAPFKAQLLLVVLGFHLAGFKVVSRLQKTIKWTISTNGIGTNGSMTNLPQKPIHPGEVLGEVYMKSFQPAVTVSDLADSIGVPPEELMDLLAGKQYVTMSLALRLAVRFRTSTRYWLRLQDLYDRQSRVPPILPNTPPGEKVETSWHQARRPRFRMMQPPEISSALENRLAQQLSELD